MPDSSSLSKSDRELVAESVERNEETKKERMNEINTKLTLCWLGIEKAQPSRSREQLAVSIRQGSTTVDG